MSKTDYIGELRALAESLCLAALCVKDRRAVELAAIKNKTDKTALSVIKALHREFVTPLDRADTACSVIALRKAIITAPDRVTVPEGYIKIIYHITDAVRKCVFSLGKGNDSGIEQYILSPVFACGNVPTAVYRWYGYIYICYETVFRTLMRSI